MGRSATPDEGDDLDLVSLGDLLFRMAGPLHHHAVPLDCNALGAHFKVAQKIRYRQTVRQFE